MGGITDAAAGSRTLRRAVPLSHHIHGLFVAAATFGEIAG
jgi:hypothetical protein